MKSLKTLLIAAAAGSALVAGSVWMVATSGDTPTAITAATQDALVHMVEEEKLAHDVYVALAAETNLSIFDRISGAESHHEASVQSLLEHYGVADPTSGNGVGEFTEPAFTTLYAQLVEQGRASDDAAMQVGVTIENLDIADLEARLDSANPADVDRVFQRLIDGSERHLAAFSR